MRTSSHVLLNCSLVLLLAGCASTPSGLQAPASAGLGETKATAIEVCKPAGERAYLGLLACADGTRPSFKRIGSFGSRLDYPKNLTKEQEAEITLALLSGRALKPGEPDYHIVDGYELACGEVKRTVYMDMYHCQGTPPAQAPTGFSLAGPK